MTVIAAGPWARLWPGSVMDELVRRLPMLLLLMRPQEPVPELGREPAIKHILVPLNGSVAAKHIVEPAAALATLMQAKVTLLRVVNPWRRPTTLPPRACDVVNPAAMNVECTPLSGNQPIRSFFTPHGRLANMSVQNQSLCSRAIMTRWLPYIALLTWSDPCAQLMVDGAPIRNNCVWLIFRTSRLELRYMSFSHLVNPSKLVTVVR